MTAATTARASGTKTARGFQSFKRPRFRLLKNSPYRVEGSAARQRFWFSDGAWLDQGQTGSVVGFVWTHWLADRGVTVEGVAFDDSYARELYAAAQRRGGQDDPTAGAFLWSGEVELRARGLVQECFTCRDIPTLTLALLERGPVVAGVSVRESLMKPEVMEGKSVWKLDPNASIIGGHAILLNGIALDLEIGGVKGFARFKNSWGREWGDQGHCLISLDDLAVVIGDDVFLPIPTQEAVGPSGRPDIAIPQADVRYAEEAISNDSWTTRDTAGYQAYADAIARGIQHPDTRPPLTIGIRAPWGAGKTSLMRMIQERLEWPPDVLSAGPGSQRPITGGFVSTLPPARFRLVRLWRSLRSRHRDRVTNGYLLRRLKSVGGESERPGAAPELISTPFPPSSFEDRWRPTVWFNPWMYQTGEQVWAGLAHEIIKQTTDRMNRSDRESFWLALNLKRVDEQAVRRKVYRLIMDRLVPWLVAAVFLVVAGVILAVFHGFRILGSGLAGGSAGLVAIFGAWNAWRVLSSGVGGGLSRLVTPAVDVKKFAGTDLTGSYDEVVEQPDYRKQSGSFYLIHSDVGRVLDLIASPQRPLVVFIDDLDRCSPATVVQVIEAINLFVAGQFSNVIFVIAMEPEMVAAHIEAAYSELVKKMAELSGSDGQPTELGWKFLEKIVHLPLGLPVMETDRRQGFYESLFGAETTDVGAEATASEADVQQVEAELSEASLSEVFGRASKATGDDKKTEATLTEAVRRTVERRLTRGDPEVEAVITYAKKYLEPNPREIKRFVRVFRFFVMIYMERQLQGLPSPGSLNDVAKLAVLAIRWPGLMSFLAEPSGANGRTIFDLLESPGAVRPRKSESQAAAERRMIRDALARAGIPKLTMERLLGSDFRTFMKTPPRVGAASHAYL